MRRAHDFYTVRKTGRQIDIKAKHRVTGQPVLCECKAYEDELEGDHLVKFRGLFDTEREREPGLVGLFFSLSRFGGGFLALYEEWNSDTRSKIKIFDADAIIRLMSEAGTVKPSDAVAEIIARKVPHPQKRMFLCVSEQGEYWAVTLTVDGKETLFTMLTAKGDEPQRYEIDSVVQQDALLGQLTLIGLDLRRKIILGLSDMKPRSGRQLAELILESPVDVESSARGLVSERVLILTEGRYTLSEEIEVFSRVSADLLISRERMEYHRSVYVQRMIGPRLMDSLHARFLFDFDSDIRQALTALLKVSPMALYELLTCSTERIRTGHEQVLGSKAKENALRLWASGAKSQVIMTGLKAFIRDLHEPGHTGVLTDHGTKGYELDIRLKLVDLRSVLLNLRVKTRAMIATAAGPIKAGQLVSATGPGALLELAAVMEQLGDSEEAVKLYDRVLAGQTDSNALKTALNNKGLALRELKQLQPAAECFESALRIDNRLKEAHFNLGLVLLELDKHTEGMRELDTALEIDPEYDLAQRARKAASEGWPRRPAEPMPFGGEHVGE